MPAKPETAIPVIDLGPFTIPGYTKLSKEETLKQLAETCETLGCFYVKNHGVDNQVVKDTISDHREFFGQSFEYKSKYIDPGNVNHGYIPFESQNVNLFMGRKGLPNDPIERFHFAPPDRDVSKLNDATWPDNPPTYKANLSKYYNGITNLAETLMKVLSLALNIPGYEDFFYQRMREGQHRMKQHLYPLNGVKKPNQDARFPEHTDAAPFAILATSACKGTLHALDERNGKWISIDSKEDMFIVNLGEAVNRWTNGHWIAPIHKVAWPETKEDIGRVSLVYFAHAKADLIIESIPALVKEGEKPKYDSIAYPDLVLKRFAHWNVIKENGEKLSKNTGY